MNIKEIKIDLGKELTHIKSFTDNTKQVKYINTTFTGGQTKEYTLKIDLKNWEDEKMTKIVKCDCRKPWECCSLCCQNCTNAMIHNVCRYQENEYGVPTLPGYKPVPGNYKKIPKIRVNIITKFLYKIGYHKPFTGFEWENEC